MATGGFHHFFTLRLIKALNALSMAALFAFAWYGHYDGMILSPFSSAGSLALPCFMLLLYCLFAKTYDAFLISYYRISEIICSQILAAFFSDVILYIVICLLSRSVVNPLPMAVVLAGQFLFSSLWATWSHQWYFRTFPAKRTVVIYDARDGLDRLIREYGLEKKFHIERTIHVSEFLCHRQPKVEAEYLSGTEVVFLSGVHSHDRNIIIKYCIEHGIRTYVIPRIGDTIMSGARPMHLLHLPILLLERYNPSPFYTVAKRLMDIVLSILLLVIFSPVMLVLAVLIPLKDRGPVFYRQIRLTKDGRCFEILKFRSMKVDAEREGGAQLSSGEDDPRVTSVGRVMRAHRLDELPQLFNILKGDMSIVGPRPERPEIAARYEKEMPEFRLRLQGKAGLTGYAQVFGKYDSSPYDKLQMDLMYLALPSLVEDLRIILATVKVLLVRNDFEMADINEGVRAEQTGADDQRKAGAG